MTSVIAMVRAWVWIRKKIYSLLPVVLYVLSQCHDFLDSLKPLYLESAPRSSLKQRHCLSSTVTTKQIHTEIFKKIKVQYLPGNMIHGNAMLLHAILSSIVRRASYFIGRCRCTVYPPLQKNKFIFLCFFPHCLYSDWLWDGYFLEQKSIAYLLFKLLISYKFSENCLSYWRATDVSYGNKRFQWIFKLFQNFENKKPVIVWIFQPRSE